MRVLKRNTRGYEPLKFDKITERISYLCQGLDPSVDPTRIALSTIKNIHDGISTEDLDKISAKIAESLKTIHPDYSVLAAKIMISNLHKSTPKRFSECMEIIGRSLDIKSDTHYDFIARNAESLDNMIIDINDYNFDYFGYKVLEASYLTKIEEKITGSDGKPVYLDNDGEVVTNVTFTKSGNPVLKNENGVIICSLREKTRDRVMDRPQYMFMRVAIAIYLNYSDPINVILENIKQCYKALSQMYFTHATPTLFNACGKVQQLNSCFLLGTGDSIEEIMRTLSNASFISKWAGGIGIHMHNIRSRDSRINGTNGKSSGLPKQLKMYNEAARCWDQGGKRLGAFAIYLEPWHGDIMKFLQLKLQIGMEEERARDLFYALWVPDLFVARAEVDADWSLFSESTAPGLSDVFDGMEVCTKCGHCDNRNYYELIDTISDMNLGEIVGEILPAKKDHTCAHTYAPKNVFSELYQKYEEAGLATKVVKAREVLDAICDLQRQNGVPYVCFKDHVNRQSNQKNIGTIKSSNLCAEIMEWSDKDSYACCTLASVNLKKFLVKNNGEFQVDHEKLHEITRLVTRNLDNIINNNRYPVPECEQNSKDYRPIGIGIQGLADVFAMMRIPFISPQAERIDLEIAETILHAALTESCAQAQKFGKYIGFDESPAAKGELPFDLWLKNQTRIGGFSKIPFSGRYDWNGLRSEIMTHGLRNSLHVAFMPTVSTSQIMGNNESFEPYPGNIYTKTTIAGKFMVSNNHMIRHLIELGLWNEDIKNRILNAKGSMMDIPEIPANVKEIYKTIWEIKQSELMRRAALRSAFVDQSQSLNIHVNDNSNKTLRGIFFHGHKLGLKTGNYYIRSQPAAQAMKNNIAQMAQVRQVVESPITPVVPVKFNESTSGFTVIAGTEEGMTPYVVKKPSKFAKVVTLTPPRNDPSERKFTAKDEEIDPSEIVGCINCSS